MIVRMHWRLASQWCPGELAAAVGDDFVHVHIELSATACHPHVQRKHVVMLTGQNFVASLRDQFVLLIAQPLAGTVCFRSSFLHNGIGSDHLPRDQVLADAEMFERTLSLRAPQLVGGNIDFAETVGFLAHVRFGSVSSCTHGLSLLIIHFDYSLCCHSLVASERHEPSCCTLFVRVSPAYAAKLKHEARANNTLVEWPGKLIVLAHEIKLNAGSLAFRYGDAAVVSGSAPGLDVSV